MKYSIRLNDTTNLNVVFEGYFVVNSSNIIVEMYETINGVTDYTQNLIIPIDNLPTYNIDPQGFQTYTYNDDLLVYFNNIYLPSWKQFNFSGILIKNMNNYNNISHINIYGGGDPTIINEGGIVLRFNNIFDSFQLVNVFFNIIPYVEPIPQSRTRMTMGSLYTNNAQIYYKSHTLAPGGIGGVRNYRLKSRKI